MGKSENNKPIQVKYRKIINIPLRNLGAHMLEVCPSLADPNARPKIETHHTVLSYDVTAQQMKDWARMMDIEFVHITKDTTVDALEKELFLNDLAWKLK